MTNQAELDRRPLCFTLALVVSALLWVFIIGCVGMLRVVHTPEPLTYAELEMHATEAARPDPETGRIDYGGCMTDTQCENYYRLVGLGCGPDRLTFIASEEDHFPECDTIDTPENLCGRGHDAQQCANYLGWEGW